MKLKVKAEKFEPKRFEEALKIMRLWPEYQKDIVHDLLKHIQYLNEQVTKLESEMRELRELSFLHDKATHQISTLSKSIPVMEKTYTTRGERYYFVLKDRAHLEYLNLNPSVTLDDMLTIANEWALTENKSPMDRSHFAEIFSRQSTSI